MLTNRKRTLHKNIYLHKWIKCGTVQIYVWINKHTSILCMWCVRTRLSIFIKLRRQNLLSNCELHICKEEVDEKRGAGKEEELLEAVLWLSSDCFCHFGNHMRMIHKDKSHLFCECLNLVYKSSPTLCLSLSFSLCCSFNFFSGFMQISLLKFHWCQSTILYKENIERISITLCHCVILIMICRLM